MCKGIFEDSRPEDVKAITHIVNYSIREYIAQCDARGITPPFEITINNNFDFISTTGGHVLSISEKYLYPNALQRVATLILLCNSFPPFSLTKNRRPYSGPDRKDFISKFTSLLIYGSLKILTVESETGEHAFLEWTNFPDEFFRDQFLFYIQGIQAMDVQVGPDGKPSQLAFEKALAHVSVGLAMALRACVKKELLRLPPPNDP